jgi:hypothetical protein
MQGIAISRLDLTPTNSIMQHAGLKIQTFPDGSICMTNQKAIQIILQAQDLQDCNPAPTPHIDGHDMGDMKPDEAMIDIKTYQSILGRCRFLADTTHLEIDYITGVIVATSAVLL